MSHNKTKIGTATPNVNSEMTVNLTDLSDVSSTPAADGQFMQYDSNTSSWLPASSPQGGSVGYIWIGGKAKSYSNSPATGMSQNSVIYIWDDAPINNIPNATISVTSGSANADENNWIQSITLPQGDYIFRAQSQFVFSASGYAAYGWQAGTTLFGSNGVVGENRGTTYGPSNSTANGYYSVGATSVTFTLKFIATSNIDSIANQGTRPSEFGLLYIEKVST